MEIEALVREPAVAGRFYPADPQALRGKVEELSARAKVHEIEGRLVALLVPHAGIEYSGAAAAAAYNVLDPGQWQSVIVVGTGHQYGVLGAAIYPGAYSTPAGRAEYDAELALALRKASPLIVESERAHRGEHSVEVQIPFLLRRLGRFKLVAMVMNTEEVDTAIRVGKAIAQAASGKSVLIVASSDLSHYPSGEDSGRVDKSTLLALESLDPAFFWTTNRFLMSRGVRELQTTWCGEGAVIAVTAAAKALGADRFQLLERLNSGDVVSERDYTHVVGYAAAAFVRAKARRAVSRYALSDEDKKALVGRAHEAIRRRALGLEPETIPVSQVPGFNLPAAVFVCVYAPGATGEPELRGCLGAERPQESLLEAVDRYSADASSEDPRFNPIAREELDGVKVEISILSPHRRVAGPDEVRPGDGVAVEYGGQSGLLLPQVWEKIPDKTQFLETLCSQKARIPKECYKDPKARLSVFTVETIKE